MTALPQSLPPVEAVFCDNGDPPDEWCRECVETVAFATSDRTVDRLKQAARFHALRVNASPLMERVRGSARQVVCRLK